MVSEAKTRSKPKPRATPKPKAKAAQVRSDWDSRPNPTFNQWTTVNLAEVFPGVAHPFDATWYHRWQTNCFRYMVRRLEIEDLVPLYEWPIPNFLAFWAGQCAASVGLTTAITSSYQVDGGSSVLEQFFTADTPGAYRATASADVARARRTRARYFHILGQVPRASAANRRRAQELADDVATLDLARLPEPELRRWLERVEVLAQHTFFHHGLASFGAGEYASMLGDHLRASLPDLAGDAVLTLTSAVGEVESARPSRALWDLSRWVIQQPALCDAVRGMELDALRSAISAPASAPWRKLSDRFHAFLEAYGYRGPTEWMVSLPDWAEDTAFPLNSLRNMVDAPAETGPEHLHARAAARRREAEVEMRARLPRSARARYDALLVKAQQFVRVREFTKSNCIRGIRPGRKVLLALGERFVQRGLMDQRDDLFLLFAQEVDEAIGGGLTAHDVRTRVARRRRQMVDLRDYVLPDNFEGVPRITRRQEGKPRVGATLSGLGVSPGIATGRACVVRDIDAASAVSMQPGDVLVAPFTDAPWTPLFLVASAVVVETGGLLSHAATVAREYGIPAVVMVKDATHLIETGQTLTVDGGIGQVVVA